MFLGVFRCKNHGGLHDDRLIMVYGAVFSALTSLFRLVCSMAISMTPRTDLILGLEVLDSSS